MVILQALCFLFWVVVLPFLMGLLPAKLLETRQRTPGVLFLFGYMMMLALFELTAIPVVIHTIYYGMTRLTNWFTGISLVLAAAGCIQPFLLWKRKEKFWGGEKDCLKQTGLEEKAIWILFLLLVGFQLYMAFTRASFDGDDAYYVVHSLTAQQQDVLYRIEPDTGKSTPLDMRHTLAVFPLWIAHVAVKSGIHATVVSHTYLPLVLLPLTYLLYFQIGKKLFVGKKDMLPVFMVIMALLQMFGNVSIYTNETFLMTRTWQGKSFAANFVIPAILWLFLWIFEENKGKKRETLVLWLLLGAVNWMAGIGSSQAALLCAMLTCLFGFFMMIARKNFWILVKAGLTCLPNAVYILLYLCLSR